MARRTTIINTKLEIIQLAADLFLTEGYSNTPVTKIANKLGISLGNLTFHFPTKEHLLAELIEFLCEYQHLVLEQEVEGGKTTLLAYLLELTSMIAICEDNEIAKDLYISAYTHPISLGLMRKSDTMKAKMIFAEYQPNWSEEDFIAAENIVSGIEYASICKENAKDVSLKKRITNMLQTVMKLYGVPADIQKRKIAQIHNMDYQRIGHRFINGFVKYVEEKNKLALDEIIEKEKQRSDDDA